MENGKREMQNVNVLLGHRNIRMCVAVVCSRVAAVRALVRDQALMAVWDFLSGALPVFVLLFTTSGIYVLISALRYVS